MNRKKRAGVAAVVTIVLGLDSTLLYSQDPNQGQDDVPATILILQFNNATGRPRLDAVSNAVPDLLTAYLSGGSGPVRVVDRQALESLYQEKALTWQSLVEGRSGPEPDVLAQARFIVRGSLSRLSNPGDDPDEIEVKAFIHETATTRLLKVIEARGVAGEIPSLCRQAASDIAAHFKAKLPPIEDLPVDVDPARSLLMIHGLNAFHNGDPHRALAAFLKIIDDHPGDEPARFWLTRSFLATGLETHARIEAQAFLKNHADSPRASQIRDLLQSLTPQSKESDHP